MVRTGMDQLLSDFDHRVGDTPYALLCHGASVDGQGRYVFDRLCGDPSTRPRMLLVPEHGLFGEQAYMEAVADTRDRGRSVPVVSLYGDSVQSLAPSRDVLSEVDLVVFDLQDVGARYYTYLATMAMTMQACATAGVRFVVTDRPNPLGGVAMEGNLVRDHLRSFVGHLPLTNRHGLTAGEAARLYADHADLDLDLEIVPCEGLHRSDLWPQTHLPFVPPSPNIPGWRTALVYPGMCLLEGTNLSEGRGTTTPFLVFGAPYMDDPGALAGQLNGLALDGVGFLPTWFVPSADKWAGKRCGGIRLVLTDERAFRPLLTGIAVVSACMNRYPADFKYRNEAYEFVEDRLAIDLILGAEEVRTALEAGVPPRDVVAAMTPETSEFGKAREPYLLYR